MKEKQSFEYCRIVILLLAALHSVFLCGCIEKGSDAVTLRVCNWEEYVDEGDWDTDETIILDDGSRILRIGILKITVSESMWNIQHSVRTKNFITR